MAKKFGDKLDELDLSHEEIDRLSVCLKDEKFRDLLRDYAEEISDPANRKKYEEEIALLERDRGMDVKFINPKPGHVLKTSLNGKQKCFINICTNENLGKPESKTSVQGSTKGMQWSIPHSVSQAREDVDKAGGKCMVYDVVFHPDTYHLLKKNIRFKEMIHDTALDAIERQFSVELDKVNFKTPKMTFKGLPASSLIRTPHPDGVPSNDKASNNVDERLKTPYPDEEQPGPVQNGLSHTQQSPAKKDSKLKENAGNGKQEEQYIEPEYSVMHRGFFDIQNHKMSETEVQDTRPKELVVNIDLPLLSAANSVNLEVFEKTLQLESIKPAKYKLNINLPYPVDENKGFAKFDKARHRLSVTLMVLPPINPPKLPPFIEPSKVSEVETENEVGENADNSSKTSEQANHMQDRPQQTENSTDKKVLESEGSNQPKPQTKEDKPKQEEKKIEPSFEEEGRRHYQQGSNWRDDDDIQENQPDSDSQIVPLTKNSAFLIDMVNKYEGLIRRCPKFLFHQDEHYVSFIIDVPHIFKESLWYTVYDHMLQFVCLSECLDGDMVNSVFQLWVEFDPKFRVDPQRSRVDVSGHNAVFCLRKMDTDLEWQTFNAGFDKKNLKIRRFSTLSNVSELYTLVHEKADGVKSTSISVCKVVKEEDNLLILELESIFDSDAELCKEDVSSTVKGAIVNSTENLSAVKSRPMKPSKTISFANDVKENVKRASMTNGGSREPDSDDENDDKKACPEVPSVLTYRNTDGSGQEVVVDHSSHSAVSLSADSLIYQLDDDV